jgi:two-component system response regulator HydG
MSTQEPSPPSSSSLSPGTDGRPAVLVADDDSSCLAICAEVLEKSGFVVYVAHDGVRALRIAAERRPDVVLTDLYLPVMDGGELIRRLRHGGIDTPVILMSGSSDGQVQAFRHQAAGFLAKPFIAGTAVETVRRVLAEDAAHRA